MTGPSKTRKPFSLFGLGAAASAALAWWAAPPCTRAAAQPDFRAASSCAAAPAATANKRSARGDPQKRRPGISVPPIDAAAPARVETAVFGLG